MSHCQPYKKDVWYHSFGNENLEVLEKSSRREVKTAI
jgi:hypothetical protein